MVIKFWNLYSVFFHKTPALKRDDSNIELFNNASVSLKTDESIKSGIYLLLLARFTQVQNKFISLIFSGYISIQQNSTILSIFFFTFIVNFAKSFLVSIALLYDLEVSEKHLVINQLIKFGFFESKSI
jgi:hypothetical protein